MLSLILIIVALVLAILAAFSVQTRVPLLPISVILICAVMLMGSTGAFR